MSLTIRACRENDLARLKEITIEGFDGVSIDQNIEQRLGPVGGHDWRWHKGRQVEGDFHSDPAGVFVAEAGGEVVGYVSTRVDSEAGVAYIPNIALASKWQGKGYGRRLLEVALDRFRRMGIDCVRIETLEQNPVGQHLYTDLGFHEVARQIHYCTRLVERPSDGS